MAKYVRFIGEEAQNESPFTGRGSVWWQGEVRQVSDAVANALVSSSMGWELCRPADTTDVPTIRRDTSGIAQAVQVDGVDFMTSGAVKWAGGQLTTVTIGNSINAGGASAGTKRNNNAGVDPAGWWSNTSEVIFANILAGSPLTFGRIAATTRADKWGNYSYSGATLAGINSDLSAQLYDAMNTAGVLPDIIICVDLLANDIAGGRTYEQCCADLQQFTITARGMYPATRIIINTPHPSYSYNTAEKVAVYQQVRDYILGLDDGAVIFASRCDAYEDPANPGKPLSGYTDASVHPNAIGASRIARSGLLPTLQRVVASALPSYRRVSNNFAATGTAAASGTNVSGTMPTNYSSSNLSHSSIVAEALQPGCSITYTKNAAATEEWVSINCGGSHAVSGYPFYAPYVVMRIDGGAEYLRAIQMWVRPTDGSTSPFFYMGKSATAEYDAWESAYQNGDILTFICPPIGQADIGLAGAITSIQIYMLLEIRTAGTGATIVAGNVNVSILDSGVGLVA